MVVHSSDGTYKNMPLPTAGNGQVKKNSTLPTVSTAMRTAGARKCCFISSMVLNLLLIGALVTTGVFMCRYKSKYCQMKIQKGIEKFDAMRVPFTVDGCDVVPYTGLRDYVFEYDDEEPVDEIRDDLIIDGIPDEDREDVEDREREELESFELEDDEEEIEKEEEDDANIIRPY